MSVTNEQLRQKAHELALTHDPYQRRWPSKNLWRRLDADVSFIRMFISSLHDNGGICAQPAEEWLLDHAEFIEEQVLDIRQQLAGAFWRNLPVLRKTGSARVLSICSDYLEQVDGDPDEESLISFVNYYQEVSVLTIAEAWSIPLILRIALIQRLAEVAKLVRDRREECKSVEKLLARLEAGKLSPAMLKSALDEAGNDMPLSGAAVVYLVRRLREWADDPAIVREWLLCRLEYGPDSLDRIISYEYQLQAAHQMATGNLIGGLRKISRLDWYDPFERICLVERTLRSEAAGMYPLLDFASRDIVRRRVEKLARCLRLPENLVAQQAVDLAAQEYEQAKAAKSADSQEDMPPRSAFAAYYLLEAEGVNKLRRALNICGIMKQCADFGLPRRPARAYFAILAGIFSVALLSFAGWISAGVSLSAVEWAVIVLALFPLAGEWAVTVAHWLIERVSHPRPLLRYDFSNGVASEATTMVVIPVIWSTVKEVQEMVERLELHYLGNRDDNIYFALLGDLADADAEVVPKDADVIAAARAGIEALNSMYPRPGGSAFYLFQRRRLWNPSEGVWMGWERKRGKLVEFVELLKGRDCTTYNLIVGDTAVLSRIRYIITLDADTELPLGSAQRMIGTIHLPYNRPRLNKSRTRVIDGYGVLQPRISISHDSAMRSRFASLWSAEPGIDPYVFAASDAYQDWLGHSIFTGKGIFDVDVFMEVLCERIPENRVLSHDLLEGGFLRTGLLEDIELIDGHPATYSAFQKRLHRWVRGDWQLLLWLLPQVKDRRGQLRPVDLPPIVRWQIIDNLRRSLLPPAQFALLLLSLTVMPGHSGRWIALVFVTLLLPLFRQLAAVKWIVWRPKALFSTAGQVLLSLMSLPFQSVLLLDAIARTLYRLFKSKRHLLEWVSAAEVERHQRGGRYPVLLGMYGGYALIGLFALAAISNIIPALRWTGLGLCALWLFAPLAVRWLNQPVPLRRKSPLTLAEKEELQKLSEQIWAFFAEYVTEKEHWLPPDNVQMEPPNGVAHRTSPTNIGLYLVCTLAARDLGFIDTAELIERLERTIGTVERLAKWYGHLYNWYDTITLEPLPPLYVSTVDSGNFAVCLVTVKQGVAEWLATDITGDKSPENMPEAINTAAEKLIPTSKVNTVRQEDWLVRGRKLIERLEALLRETDFRPLYNDKTKLFHLGYNGSMNKTDEILYDLLASEARLSSYIAIALGQVPVSHWYALGRTMTRVGRRVALLSWSGTMFEFLMPWLFMHTYRNTVWDSTYYAVVQRQIEYARQRGVPFGISESGYYAFDHQMNYQYRAFGVPGLGFKRGLEQDLVVAPYATIMALPFAKRPGLSAIRWFEELGARGQYGFFEAIDFTTERLPENRDNMVIRSYMAHHQGMSLLALANLLAPKKITERFHNDKRVQAAQLLLQERIPVRPKIIKHSVFATKYSTRERPTVPVGLREYRDADTLAPEVCVLSNGTFTTVVTNSGSGFSRFNGLAVTRWREDPVLDNWGSYMYIRDVTRNTVWSPAFQPCRKSSAQRLVQFSLDRATFMCSESDIRTSLEICVSPEWNAEIRRLTLANASDEERIIEVTTFLELALASPMADDAHPAFSKLFIQTAYADNAGCLLAQRRPRRESEKSLWAAHSLLATGRTLGALEYDTDRASFIGRGHTLALPQGIYTRLRQTAGSVVDPAFVMRRRVSIEPGEQVQFFAVTAVADTREEAIDIIGRFTGELAVERTFQLAWNRSQTELRHLHLTAAQAVVFQEIAGRVLYTPPLRLERRRSLLANAKSQSGLWAYGVSGDLPVIILRIENKTDMRFAVEFLTGHEYLRRLGLFFDLVVLNESAGGYREELQDSLRRAMEQVAGWHGAGPGKVVIINAGQLPAEDRTLLFAVARMVLRADGPSISAQSKILRPVAMLPASLRPTAPRERFEAPKPEKDRELVFFNGWGGFSADGREYSILLKNGNHLPAPWINVIANPRFGCLISELGTGYTWWLNSREFKLTPWFNDPVLDPSGEACFLRDEESGEIWSAFSNHVEGSAKSEYIVTHGRGFSRFCCESNGIRQELTVFVPMDDSLKIISLKLKNGTNWLRRLSVTYYAEWVLGVQRQANASFIITEWDESARVMLARNVYQEHFREAWAFLGIYADTHSQMAAAEGQLSWTADRNEFIGRNGTRDNPAAMQQECLSGRTGPVYDACGAIQAKLALDPGEETTVYILLGAAASREAAVELASKYRKQSECHKALADVQNFWNGILGQISVSTPSQEMDLLLNSWLLYQSLGCRMWARTAFYQAGGAYGFRDQLQDSLALLHTRPDITRAQILLHAAHQYEEGDVQHWWHEETQRGIRTRFTDDLLWLPYVVSRYVEQTEDYGILEEVIPFLSSEPLADTEHERYELTRRSTAVGTLMEHCFRAINRSIQRFGEHGLPLIGIGDWNDGMSNVGPEGRGESVWLGWFLCEVLDRFAVLCQKCNHDEQAGLYRAVRGQLAESLDKHAWDGQWYRRAFTDAGQWLGSIYNEECRIDAIAQSWAVISRAAAPEKAQLAMQSFDRELVDRELALARLLTPPFDRTNPSPGYIQGYPPGLRENGAQYTHGAIWGIIAWCYLGDGDKAFELFQLLNPLNHTRTPGEARHYSGEPYVMAADVYTAEPHRGRAGWTWYTGAAGWMYQAGIEGIIGLRRRGRRLFISPCIPRDWPEFNVTYRFGSACWHISVKNPARKSQGGTLLQIDGREFPLTTGNDPYIELCDDGRDHYVSYVL